MSNVPGTAIYPRADGVLVGKVIAKLFQVREPPANGESIVGL